MITYFQKHSMQHSKVKPGACAPGKIVQPTFFAEDSREFGSESLASDELKKPDLDLRQKCYETFGENICEKMVVLLCNKMIQARTKDKTLLEDDEWTHTEVAEEFERQQVLESKTGLRKKFTGKVKRVALSLGSKLPKPLNPHKGDRISRVAFDQESDIEWLLGYLPDIIATSISSNVSDLEFPGYLDQRAMSNSKRSPYPTKQMWLNEDSNSIRDCNSQDSGTENTPVDVEEIMGKYQGLEAILITDELLFFINNIGANYGKTEVKYQTASLSKKPPSITNYETILRPLSLVKGSKLLQLPKYGEYRQNFIGNNKNETTCGDFDRGSKNNTSPSFEGILKEIKLVTKLSEQKNSFTVPVMLNMLNMNQKQRKLGRCNLLHPNKVFSGISNKIIEKQCA